MFGLAESTASGMTIWAKKKNKNKKVSMGK
jgi:hypothetical protein